MKPDSEADIRQTDDDFLASEICGFTEDARFKFIDEKCSYEGHRYHMYTVKESLPNNVVVDRDVIRHPGAAVILPLLDEDTVLLVEQHRTAFGHNLLEIPAGLLEADEDPLQSAHRELREETGFVPGSLELVMEIFPAAGFSDEKMFIFKASDLTEVGQDTDDDEWVRVIRCSKERARDLLLRGEIRDGKTIVALQYWLGATS